MKNIVGYFSSNPTWRRVSEKEYKKILKHDLAIHYLKNEIYESVDREMKHILKGDASGFYAGLRFLFPEITHLAHLYYGYRGKVWKSIESKYSSRFMRKFKILSPQCGLYYEVFRHGLMHSHHPKWLRKGKSVNAWYISNTEELDMFGVSLPKLTTEIKNAISSFIYELEREKGNYRLNRFFNALVDCGKILYKNSLTGYARYDIV